MPPLRGSLVSVELDPLAGAVAPVDQEREQLRAGRAGDAPEEREAPPSSPRRRPSYPSSPTWASPPPHPHSPAHVAPPLWDQAAEPVAHWADSPAPVPEFVFDQPLELVAARTFPSVLSSPASRGSPAPALPCAPHSHPPTHLSSRSKPRELPQAAFASASRAPADSLRP